jgi:hypothetical protein
MKSALHIAILSLFACAPAHAYQLETGSVLICDTQQQVERYVQLFDGDDQVAISAVNTEEHDPNACSLVEAAYVQGPQVGVERSRSYAFGVAPIVVVAIATERGYKPVKPGIFFTLVRINEFAV